MGKGLHKSYGQMARTFLLGGGDGNIRPLFPPSSSISPSQQRARKDGPAGRIGTPYPLYHGLSSLFAYMPITAATS